MDDCFLYRNPPFGFPYTGLFNPLRNFHDNQFAITGPDGEMVGKRGKEEERKRREKKRLSQIFHSDSRRQRLNDRLRAKLENRKTKDEKSEDTEQNNVLSEQDLLTLFESEEKPKKRKRKKRKNKKKKKESSKTTTEEEGSAGNSGTGVSDSLRYETVNDSVLSELSEVDGLLSESLTPSPADDKELVSAFVLEREEFALKLIDGEEDDLLCGARDLEAGEEKAEDEEQLSAGEEPSLCGNGEHISCGDSTSTERSTSEHDEKEEAGETVSVDGEHDENEEERSTISPEERGNLEDDFPWHLYQTDDPPYDPSLDDTGFTVVRRKEKRPRKRRPSPPRKKKRKQPRRSQTRRQSQKEKPPSPKRKTILKNSPRTACPIRNVTPQMERNPAPMQQLLIEETITAPALSPPPGFEAKTPTCPEAVPELTKPFEQFQSINAVFTQMPSGSIITVPFIPVIDVHDFMPMNLDLSYPLDCTYHFIPSEAPIDCVQLS